MAGGYENYRFPAKSTQYGGARLPDESFAHPRRRFNFGAALVCFLVPWVTFTLTAWLLCFHAYDNRTLCWGIIAIEGIGLIAVGLLTLNSRWGERTWHVFFFLSLLLAILLGIAMGLFVFGEYMSRYYTIASLNTYMSVDTKRVQGESVMDAGRIMFAEDTGVDLAMSAAFTSDNVYCAAPIITKGEEKLHTYDFWAVGQNCCSETDALVKTSSVFHCGPYNDPLAHGAVRLLDEKQEAYYRLAVQQAEAAFGIKARHPLFFTWTPDPVIEVKSLEDMGLRTFLLGTLTFFGVQGFLVCFAGLIHSEASLPK